MNGSESHAANREGSFSLFDGKRDSTFVTGRINECMEFTSSIYQRIYVGWLIINKANTTVCE